jgi:hypothetical protein
MPADNATLECAERMLPPGSRFCYCPGLARCRLDELVLIHPTRPLTTERDFCAILDHWQPASARGDPVLLPRARALHSRARGAVRNVFTERRLEVRLGRNFSSLAPELQQTFYIGDGLTGEGSGAVQSFLVPDTATRLFLGFLDGAYFVGGPDYYDNNRGSFAVTAVAVPEPSTCAMALAGLACGGYSMFRRRKQA